MRFWIHFVVATAAAGSKSLASGSLVSPPSACSASNFSLPDSSTIVSTEHLHEGQVLPLPDTVESCGGPDYSANATTDLCRVVINVATSNSSSIRLEAWLPDHWNGRFLATGNGGTGGCIDYTTVQNGAKLGFAAFGTNAGHDGQEGHKFFLNKPEVINDWGHRAIHVEARVGKKVVGQYYGSQTFKSYYQGCSTGGRQGLQSAHDFPGDFDGILVGAPGIDWIHVVASKGILARRIGWPDLDSSAYVRREQWEAIQQVQIDMFDAKDGVSDGIIDDPRSFNLDPELLSCGTGVLNSSVCLSAEQVASVRAAYEPITDTAGHVVYPPFGLGSDTSVFSENEQSGKPHMDYRILEDFWRGAVYNDSTWTANNFSESEMDFAVKINPGGIGFADRDLSDFYDKGGKILAYHGLADESVTPALSTEYFSGVRASLGLTLDEIHSFYRMFLLPGMGHCSGGSGAWEVGQSYPLDTKVADRDHNALLALVNWVEKGRAPKSIVGSMYADEDTQQAILGQRRQCPYPYQSIWDGQGSPNVSTSWNCGLPIHMSQK